jgi:hypothetical protein
MTRRALFAFMIGLLPLIGGGCAAGGPGTATDSDRELLTTEDLAPYGAQDAYAVIRRLRGHWFSTRSTGTQIDPTLGSGGLGQVKVYVDGVLRPDGLEALKQLTVNEIREMRHLDGRDATMQYGTDHGAGAILVFTGR